MVETESIPPHDLEAERSVIATCLYERDAQTLVCSELAASSFYSLSHQIIFAIIFQAEADNLHCDELILRSRLQASKRLDEIGGTKCIFGLTERYATSANLEAHLRIVHDCAERRKLIEAATTMLREAQEHKDVEEIRAKHEERLKDVARSATSIITIGDALEEADKVSSLAHPTGHAQLDDALGGGWPVGGMVLIGGDAKAGKTALCLDAIREAMHLGTSVFIVSRDQAFTHVVDRIWAAEASVGTRELRESKPAAEARKKLSVKPIYIHRGGYAISSVCASIRVAVARYNVSMIIVDYLQRLHVPGEKRVTGHVAAAEALTDIAQDTNTVMLVISRVVKPTEGTRGASQHRFAGEAGVQNAPDIMVWVKDCNIPRLRPKESGKTVHVFAGRYNNAGDVPLILEGAYSRYRNLTLEEREAWRTVTTKVPPRIAHSPEEQTPF